VFCSAPWKVYAPGEYRSGDLASLVRRRMAAVAEIYQRIIYQQQTRGRSSFPARNSSCSALSNRRHRTPPASRS